MFVYSKPICSATVNCVECRARAESGRASAEVLKHGDSKCRMGGIVSPDLRFQKEYGVDSMELLCLTAMLAITICVVSMI